MRMKKKGTFLNQSTFYPKSVLTGRTGSTCSRERSATGDVFPSWMSFITRFSYPEIAFQGIVNLKTCWEIEIESERQWVTCLWSEKKKNQKKGQKSAPGGKIAGNWYVISDFVRRSVRLIRNKCTCFPIGDVRGRRRERYNRVYVLSRIVYVQTEFHCNSKEGG